MENRRRVAIVLGYGCHLTDPIKRYLEKVAAYDSAIPFYLIITTGGFTQEKSAPGVSEARMMADYLESFGVSTPVILEEEALTTLENLRFVYELVRANGLENKKLVIFCDSARAFKIKLLARLIFGKWPRIASYDFSKSVRPKLKQLFINTPIELLAFFVPPLERLGLRKRERLNANR